MYKKVPKNKYKEQAQSLKIMGLLKGKKLITIKSQNIFCKITYYIYKTETSKNKNKSKHRHLKS